MKNIPGYTLVEQIYQSANCDVYRAMRQLEHCGGREDEQLTGSVIIKVINEKGSSVDGGARFQSCCRYQQVLQHPLVNQVVEVVELADCRLLVTEDINGVSLDSLLKSILKQYDTKPLADVEFRHQHLLQRVKWAIQITEAVVACHEQNIIHNDVNPSNIIVNLNTQQLQLIDFDAALYSDADTDEWAFERHWTTLTFASPEQTGRLNRTIDYRSDYYGLGATFYQLFGGRPPFITEDIAELIHCHIARSPQPLSDLNSLLPKALSAVVSKLMEKAPEDRYQNGHSIIDDLKRIYGSISAGEELALDQLVQHDIPETLRIPTKLYGRNKEIAHLVEWMHDDCVILVSGLSGAGKTAVVQESLLQLEPKKKLILRGKFEQYQHYSHEGLVQALSFAVDYILALPPEIREGLCAQLNEIFRRRDSLLFSLVPELCLLVNGDMGLAGNGTSVSLDRGGKFTFDDASSGRLKLELMDFVEWLANYQPLLVYLDDIQWCDNATFELLEALIRLHHPQITFVFTAREDGLDPLYGVEALRQASRKTNTQKTGARSTNISLKQLSISNLQLYDVERMLQDIFCADAQQTLQVSQLILTKTLGNPFFIQEFLKSAYDQGQISFDQKEGEWSWDLETLAQVAPTGNVIDILLNLAKKLPKSTKILLDWAACLGKSFDIAVLSGVAGMDEDDVFEALVPAIKQGFIQRRQLTPIYHPQLTHNESPFITLKSLQKKVAFCFSHDRIQQSIYEQSDDDSRAQRHNTIAHVIMLNDGGRDEIEESVLFPVLPHLVVSVNNKKTLTQLTKKYVERSILYLLKGSERVRKINDGKNNILYLSSALMLLERVNKQNVELHYSVLIELAEAEYMEGYVSDSRLHFDECRKINVSQLKKAEAYYRELMVEALGKEPSKIVLLGINALNCLGVDIPSMDQDFTQLLLQEEKILADNISKKSLQDLIRQPLVTDPDKVLVHQVLERTMVYSALTFGLDFSLYFILRGINLLFQEGCTAASSALLSFYAMKLLLQKKYSESNRVAKDAVAFLEKNEKASGIFTKSYTGGVLGRFFMPYEQCIKMIDEVEAENRKLGDIQLITINKSHRLYLSFIAGDSLKKLKSQAVEIVNFSEVHGNMMGGGIHYWRLIDQLIDPASPDYFNKEYFTDDGWAVLQQTRVAVMVNCLELSNLFWHNKYSEVCEKIEMIDADMDGLCDLAVYDEYQFIKIIAILQNCSSDDDSEIEKVVASLDAAISHLNTIAELCPENFSHYSQLANAEVERITKKVTAAGLYYQAAETAKRNRATPIYALAQELQGVYWKRKERMEYAHLHFSNAVRGYSKWGSETKVLLMESLHGHSLSFKRAPLDASSLESWSDAASWGEATANISSASSITESAGSAGLSPSASSSRGRSNALDNISYLKVANAIAEEMDLNALMLQIIRVVLENVGAERGYLLLKKNSHYLLHAEAVSSSDGIKVIEVVDSEHADGPHILPNNIINYCAQTKTPVLLDDAQEDNRFVSEDYLKTQKTKSLICFPIIHKDNARAMFVLVNNSVSSVFTQQHLQFITTLAPQFAVSIENALLYQQLTQLNSDLENTIGHRTEELKAANEELQAFSSSVSHDLKAPLRAISGLSLALKEDCADELPEEGLEYIQHVCDASKRMGHIIDGLLMLSRSTQSELHWDDVDLSDVVNEKIRWLRKLEPNRRVVTNIQSGVSANGDVQLIHQVIDNLMSNAWKYSMKNSQACIEFGCEETSRNKRTFYVRDNGAGFDAENAEELFKPFRRFHAASEFEGTGIGLATVYRIINRHGGNIWVESEPNKGATFYFTLDGGEIS